MSSNPLKRMAMRIAAATAPLAFMGAYPSTFDVKSLEREEPPHGYYSKGHYRHNDQQKTRARNLRVAKRRAQNKASRKARRKQRR